MKSFRQSSNLKFLEIIFKLLEPIVMFKKTIMQCVGLMSNLHGLPDLVKKKEKKIGDCMGRSLVGDDIRWSAQELY